MNKLDLYVTLSTFAEVDPEPLYVLERSGLRFGVNMTGKRPSAEEVRKNFGGAAVLVAGVEEYAAPILTHLYQEGLRCISRCGVGMENINLEAAKKLGIKILNTPEEPVQAVAEHTLCLILALLRNLPEINCDTKEGKWKRHTGNLLQGKKLGIIGYGRIGKKTAALAKAFGADVLVLDPAAERQSEDEIALNLDDLLSRSDIVSLHCPPGAVLLQGKDLQKMKRGAWLVNTARGGLVEEEALVEALNEGRLAGVALDVFSQEPYGGALLQNPKAILTPHQATLTKETRIAMEVKAVKNGIAFLKSAKR